MFLQTGLKPGDKQTSLFIETKRKPVPETYQTTHGAGRFSSSVLEKNMAESGSLPTLKLFPEDVPSLEWVVEH